LKVVFLKLTYKAVYLEILGNKLYVKVTLNIDKPNTTSITTKKIENKFLL